MCKGYYRMEIWECNLSKHNLKNHFCVILSNFKNNTRSKSLNVALITSKVNSLKSRVNINLYEPSQIALETLLTVNKEDCLYRLCKIEDVFTVLEIEKVLEQQLQLSKKYINDNVELLESFITKGVQRMDNESKSAELKNEICNLYLENKYQDAINMCNKLINSSKNIDYLFHAYYHMALSFNKLEQCQISLDNARIALQYVGSLRDGVNFKYSCTMWLISKNMECLGDIKSSIQIYKNLNLYFKKVGKLHMRIEMVFNYYRLKCNVSKMKYLISLVEKIDYRETQTNKSKVELIRQMNEDLSMMQ
jgi:tetratricopeptide (TPR) repeat protein